MEEKMGMKTNKMEATPMFKLLMSMSLPAMCSMLIQSLYNIVDSLFVAQIGEDALTAVSLGFPIQTLIIAVAVGTGIGINSLISRSLGEKNYEKAAKVADHGIVLALASWVVFAVIGIFFTKAFFEKATPNPAIIKMGTQYISIVTICSIGCFVQINIEKIFQATGNMLYPMLMQMTGAIINIILDPIFIFGWFGIPAMGVAGAAIATVIGQISGMLLGIYLMNKKTQLIKISFKGFKIIPEVIKEIYKVGFPSIIMQSIMAIVVMVLNTILIALSQSAVSVLGIYFKLQSFVFMPVFGLTQGALPIMGYSYGAKNKERLVSCIKNTLIVAGIIMAVGTVIFNGMPQQLLGMFNGSEELFRIGVLALRIISIGFVFAAFSIVVSTFFQAIGDGVHSLIISFVRQIIILLPCAWLLAKQLGVVGVWLAFPIAEVFAAICSVIFFVIKYKKKIRNL